MSRASRRVLTAVVAIFVLFAGGLSVRAMTDSASPARVAPDFVSHACSFQIQTALFPNGSVRCGFVRVPESRSTANGRTIQLAVAVFKNTDPQRVPDPLIWLVGGPGSSIVGSLGSNVATNGIPGYVGNRDLILVDQRGTGLSRPSLACPEFDTVGKGATTRPLSSPQVATLQHAALRQCRARLVKAGIDLNAYNTVENAADIADLRTALGYQQVNIYGGSYGSRLALQVMRDHPEGIRSGVIDAVADPTFNEYNDTIPNAWRAIQHMFTACAAAPGCRATDPHLAGDFNAALAHLQKHPITVHEVVPQWGGTYPITFDGARFASLVMGALYSATIIPQIPGVIEKTAHGDYTALTKVDSLLTASNLGSSEGMYLSMECADDQATASRAKIAASAKVLPSSIRRTVTDAVAEAITRCTIWKVKSTPATNRQNFSSDIPTLLMEGSFDPRTPPANAKRVAARFSHSFYLEFPSVGHGVVGTGACSDTIVSGWLAKPSQRPSAGCIATLPPAYY